MSDTSKNAEYKPEVLSQPRFFSYRLEELLTSFLVLLSPDKAPTGIKRVPNLLSQPPGCRLIVDYLTKGAQTYVQKPLEEEKELLLLLWEEGVQEKTESLQSKDLCAVRCVKAKRQLRVKPGYYAPHASRSICRASGGMAQLGLPVSSDRRGGASRPTAWGRCASRCSCGPARTAL